MQITYKDFSNTRDLIDNEKQEKEKKKMVLIVFKYTQQNQDEQVV